MKWGQFFQVATIFSFPALSFLSTFVYFFLSFPFPISHLVFPLFLSLSLSLSLTLHELLGSFHFLFQFNHGVTDRRRYSLSLSLSLISVVCFNYFDYFGDPAGPIILVAAYDSCSVWFVGKCFPGKDFLSSMI